MPSVETRLILFALMFLVFLGLRTGFFKWLIERRRTRIEEERQEKARREKRERLKKKKKQREKRRKRTAEILRRAAPGLYQRTAAAAGHLVWYLEGGSKDADTTVLLLHGFAGEKEGWAGFASRLIDAGHRVIAPDLPGFGQNEKDRDQSYDYTTQAKRIRAFVRQLGLERYHVVGCSMGGAIGAAHAYACRDEVASLTLIEPFGIGVPYQSELDQLLTADRNPMVIATPAAYDNLLRFLYAEPVAMLPELKQYRAEEAAAHRAFYLKVWQELRHGERANLLDLLLPELEAPILVLLGAESKVIHGSTVEVVQALNPKAQTAVLQDCGHFPMVERPQETAERFLDFLRTVPVPTADTGSSTAVPAP